MSIVWNEDGNHISTKCRDDHHKGTKLACSGIIWRNGRRFTCTCGCHEEK